MDRYQSIELLSELLRCGDNLYMWSYDKTGRVEYSNCPDEGFLDASFALFDCKRLTVEYGEQHDNPITVGTAFGLKWAAAFEKKSSPDLSPNYSAITGTGAANEPVPDSDAEADCGLKRIYVIGPFFYQDISEQGIREGLKYYRNIETSMAWRKRFPEVLRTIPTVQHMQISRYLLMLHYCLSGEHLAITDIDNPLPPRPFTTPDQIYHDRHKTWQTEQALLQMVRNGDRNYREALSASMAISSGVPVQGKDPLRQAKTSVMVFTTLVTRAAIEGGLSPEAAYSLGDNYLQSAESAETGSDLDALALGMYDDFINRVHRVKTRPDYSPEVRRCVDYIELHPEEKIRAADLANLIGYSEYYLTRRFREETGMSVSDYTKNVKIEAAKTMLRDSDMTAQEIADRLNFSSRNYFSKCFQDVTGMTPTGFREG